MAILQTHACVCTRTLTGTQKRLTPSLKSDSLRGAWQAQLGEHVTPDVRVVSSSPTLGDSLLNKKKKYRS